LSGNVGYYQHRVLFLCQHIATPRRVNGNAWTYYGLHGDHLSSTRRATNSSGVLHSSRKYVAYGRLDSATNTLPTASRGHPRFTGQKLDGTGLQYFNARYDDPQLGTFISPDTLVPDPGVVFDYNRYMYVRGNPMRLVDPTGHCASPPADNGNPATMQMANDNNGWGSPPALQEIDELVYQNFTQNQLSELYDGIGTPSPRTIPRRCRR
jgi:RHS repeat-associated protein